jgi:eukaryotic-like serine/threonine-protein kinase
MAHADLACCASCGAPRAANAPEGLCPRCVLRQAIESNSQPDDTPIPGWPRVGPVLDTLAITADSVPRIRLLDTEATASFGDGDGADKSDSDPAMRLDSSEVPPAFAVDGRLELLGEIARGGMGAVLKVRDTDLGRDLAVKVLLEGHKDKPDLLRRFLEEAQIAGQLQHPGIVPVYEVGAFTDRRPYFSMKLVKGRTLAGLLDARDGPDDDLPRFISIYEQICRTIAYAHSRGVIHRDLKPSNVMVGSFGEVQVMDWGLAKVLASGGVADESRAIERHGQMSVVRTLRTGSGSDLSQAGSVMGTPAYMPPEQAGGDIEALDERADVFGLGAILCEVLTGAPPYIGQDGNEVFKKALRGDLADAFARLGASGADAELIELARSCLAPELLDRPRDARVMAERLTDHLAGVQERLRSAELASAAASARATDAMRKARAERRARRLTAGLAAAVLATIALGGSGAAWFVSARNASTAAVARESADTLDRVIVLKAKARAAPPGAVIPWEEALAEANRAAGQTRELADRPLNDRIAREIAELEQGRRAAIEQAARLATDRKLLSELESIRGNRADHNNPKQTDAEYAAAFRQAGLDLDATDSKQAGAWLAARSAPIELASFLDDWVMVRVSAHASRKDTDHLFAAARAADPNPWRDALRASSGEKGAAALKAVRKLAADKKELDAQPVESLMLLADRLKIADDHDSSAQILRQAWRLRPDDFWVNWNLAHSLGLAVDDAIANGPKQDEAVRHLTAAVSVRPGSALAHACLSHALIGQGKSEEALTEIRVAIRLKPDDTQAYVTLGVTLGQQGKFREAMAADQTAIRLEPGNAHAHNNLGAKLCDRVCDYARASDEFREAIRLEPHLAEAHIGLGAALSWQGNYEKALEATRAALALAGPEHQKRFPRLAQQIPRLERKIRQLRRLPAVLTGQDRPSPAERAEFGELCYEQGLYAASVRLHSEAFTADPKLADGWSHNAASSAALAGCGKGKDDPAPDQAARTKLRGQALDWLKAELATRGRLDAGDSNRREDIVLEFNQWKVDNDLAAVREPEALKKLPDAERKAWEALWAEVDRLLERAGAKP